MNIILIKSNNRYGFNIYSDSGEIFYSSPIHYFLIPSIKSGYKYAWEACCDAWKLAKKKNYHLKAAREDMEKTVKTDISAEDMLIDHYLSILRNIRRKVKSSLHEDQETKDSIYKEIQMVSEEINTILDQITSLKDKSQLKRILSYYEKLIQKYFPEKREEKIEETSGTMEAEQEVLQNPTEVLSNSINVIASTIDNLKSKITNSCLIEELLDEYGQRSCCAIQDRHSDSYYVCFPDKRMIVIYDFQNNPLLRIAVNEDLVVNNVLPEKKIRDLCPFYSVDFYQRYWKPIVENLGHYCIGDPPILIIPSYSCLPDFGTSNQTHKMEGWNCRKKDKDDFCISFRGEKPIWVIESSDQIRIAESKILSKYTEQDYRDALVRCIDPQLKTIYNRTGSVIQVVPGTDIIEIDVDFGRGLGPVRLVEQQIEIIPVGV